MKRTTIHGWTGFHCNSCFGRYLKKRSPVAVFICTYKRIKLLLKCLQITFFQKNLKSSGCNSCGVKSIYKVVPRTEIFIFKIFCQKNNIMKSSSPTARESFTVLIQANAVSMERNDLHSNFEEVKFYSTKSFCTHNKTRVCYIISCFNCIRKLIIGDNNF